MITLGDDDSPLPHGEPISVRAALAWGLVLVLIVLLVVVRGGSAFVVSIAP
jgi:hypothetical protein